MFPTVKQQLLAVKTDTEELFSNAIALFNDSPTNREKNNPIIFDFWAAMHFTSVFAQHAANSKEKDECLSVYLSVCQWRLLSAILQELCANVNNQLYIQ